MKRTDICIMQKDETIVTLIEKLRTELGECSFEIVDHWTADLCAIGLKKGKCLVYISTYNYSQSVSAGYDYDLEIIDGEGDEQGKLIHKGRSVSEKELMEEIKRFWNDNFEN